MTGSPLPELTVLEASAPRPSPPAPLPATINAVLALHDRKLLDVPTARAALRHVKRGATLPDVLEACGVPHTLRDKADDALRPLSTRLDGATAVALVLVPPAIAALAGELARLAGAVGAASVVLVGLAVLLAAPPRRVKGAAGAAACAGALALGQATVSPGAHAGVLVAMVVLSAAAFAARPVGAHARSAATGLLAAATVEALRVVLAQAPVA